MDAIEMRKAGSCSSGTSDSSFTCDIPALYSSHWTKAGSYTTIVASRICAARADLDDDIGHTVANGGGGGGVSLQHLLGQLHVRALGVVVVERLGQALQRCQDTLSSEPNYGSATVQAKGINRDAHQARDDKSHMIRSAANVELAVTSQ